MHLNCFACWHLQHRFTYKSARHDELHIGYHGVEVGIIQMNSKTDVCTTVTKVYILVIAMYIFLPIAVVHFVLYDPLQFCSLDPARKNH